MFLDTGVVFDAIAGKPEAVDLLEGESQLHMSTVSLTEYLEGRIRAGASSIDREMDRIPGVIWHPYTKHIGMLSGRLQIELENAGNRLGQRDLMIAATAVDVGDRLVVSDADLQVPAIESRISVSNIRE